MDRRKWLELLAEWGNRKRNRVYPSVESIGWGYMTYFIAALGEALSHAFRVTLVHTVPGRTLTLPHAFLRPPERQRRLTRSPRRPSDDRVASAAAILALLASAKTPKMARRSGPSTAVSCISRAFRTFNACPRLLYRVWRPKTLA